MKESSVIVSGARTPFGRLGGVLAPVGATGLGATAIRGALDRSGVQDNDVDYAVMGLAVAAGTGQVPSRQATIAAGLPIGLASETINKVCISGLRAVSVADQMIRAGEAGVVVAGGMESMSNAPYLLRGARFGYRLGRGDLFDSMVSDGLEDPVVDVHMGVHNDRVSAQYGISREEQDAWALRSHQRAIAAMDSGRLSEEIVPVRVNGKKGDVTVVDSDEAPRRNASAEALAALPPAFAENGVTTAGNAPGVNDGAAAMVVASTSFAKKHGLEALAQVVSWATVAEETPYLAKCPALAALQALKRIGKKAADVTLWEINEAFAAVTINSMRILGIDPKRVNVNGGAIAFGHPLGASGARILFSLILELRRRGGGLGVAAICGGTAQGDAVVVEA